MISFSTDNDDEENASKETLITSCSMHSDALHSNLVDKDSDKKMNIEDSKGKKLGLKKSCMFALPLTNLNNCRVTFFIKIQ